MKNLEMKNLALIIWRRKGSLSIDYLGQVLDYIFLYLNSFANLQFFKLTYLSIYLLSIQLSR